MGKIADQPAGTTVKVDSALVRGLASGELAGEDAFTIVDHGGGHVKWTVVELPNGQQVRLLDSDLDDAILS